MIEPVSPITSGFAEAQTCLTPTWSMTPGTALERGAMTPNAVSGDELGALGSCCASWNQSVRALGVQPSSLFEFLHGPCFPYIPS